MNTTASPQPATARPLPTTIPEYLEQLREALRGADPAMVQDALYDAEEYLRSELSEQAGRSEAEVTTDTTCSLSTVAWAMPLRVASADSRRALAICRCSRRRSRHRKNPATLCAKGCRRSTSTRCRRARRWTCSDATIRSTSS